MTSVENHRLYRSILIGRAASGKVAAAPGHPPAAFKRRSEATRNLIFEADRFT